MKHNEDSRVKLPALLHCKRLGYSYQTKKQAKIDGRNNIFVDIFKSNINRINNKEFDDSFIDDLIAEIHALTDNSRDKGKSFYERLMGFNAVKLIDLTCPHNNDFRVVTELTFKGEREEFRPDVTILINGIPLAFIEVKKPNNQHGMQAEFSRMKYRLGVAEFLPFFNQFQVVGFTNNMPYDDEARVKLEGGFYTTPNDRGTTYNTFREEKALPVTEYLDDAFIDFVLNDNNLISIKGTPEFQTNLKPDTYANEFITSVFSLDRLIFFIRYGIAYVDSQRDGLQKHIIRYPQFFAIEALVSKLGSGLKRGVIWHTQGSGKTALSYLASNVLRDHFQKEQVITKFYFVVDRLDLLIQASSEFSSRGMTIAAINSRDDFKENIKSPVIVPSGSQDGRYTETMNVVNIQKFSEESTVDLSVNKNIQRVYFLDEVHRSYKPKGTFLANLLGADPNGIFIGLTGTPILKREFKTTDLFHDYIHKYYYNRSIADGYTLKIKKENISTRFKNDIRTLLHIEEGKKIPLNDWQRITEAPEFVDELCQYISDDFIAFRDDLHKDSSLGAMLVAASSKQARAIQDWFEENGSLNTALVLYDEDDNKERQEEFRGKRKQGKTTVESKYDVVIVFNMLLTGFDAPRLKRLYLLREIKEHSLLQTLARVNRPYKNMKYGYIVDFVDITEQYEETNRRYLEELKADIMEDEGQDVNDMIVDVEKVKSRVKSIENKLFTYMGHIETNLEAFRLQIQPLDEKNLREIQSSLSEYKECYNELRMSHEDVSNIPIDRISKALSEVTNRINLKVAERLLDDSDIDDEDIDFTQLIVEFLKMGEVDLNFTSDNDILERVGKINNSFSTNNDPGDEKYVELRGRFKDIIRMFRDAANTTEKVLEVVNKLDGLLHDILLLNAQNNGLTSRYNGDVSCMRIHKRILKEYSENLNDMIAYQIITDVTTDMEKLIGHMYQPSQEVILHQMLSPVKQAFKKQGITPLSLRQVESICYLFIDHKYKTDK